MSVVEGVERDLDSLSEDLKMSALGQLALALAADMDDPENSATSKSMVGKALIETMDRLRALAPPKREKTKRDELAERRSERRASGVAGSARQKRS